jgi:hypothetical protein
MSAAQVFGAFFGSLALAAIVTIAFNAVLNGLAWLSHRYTWGPKQRAWGVTP